MFILIGIAYSILMILYILTVSTILADQIIFEFESEIEFDIFS